MAIGKRDVASIAMRLAWGIPVLIWLGEAYGRYYTNFWLPWYRFILEFILPDYRLLSLDLVWRGGESLIAGKFISTGFQVIHGQVAAAGFTVNASTLMGHALLHPIMLTAAVLAWPRLNWTERAIRMLASVPFLVVVETLDIPIVLASTVTDMVSWSASPEAAAASQFINWSMVLNGGGRMALIIAAAIGAAHFHTWLVGHPKSTGVTSPLMDSTCH